MKRYKIIMTVAVFIVLALFSSQSSALGISPARQTIEFSPNEVVHGQITLVNSGDAEMTYSLSAQGALTENIEIPTEVTVGARNENKISYELKLPSILSSGYHDIMIIATEKKDEALGQTGVMAKLAVASAIRIFVPYPGKYPVIDLVINRNEEAAMIKVIVENLGDEEIAKTFAALRMIGQGGSSETVATETISIPSRERRDLVAEWSPKEEGKYGVEITLHYDGREIIKKQEIMLEKGQKIQDVSKQESQVAVQSVVKEKIKLKKWLQGLSSLTGRFTKIKGREEFYYGAAVAVILALIGAIIWQIIKRKGKQFL